MMASLRSHGAALSQRFFDEIPLPVFVPNMITLLGLFAGMTAVKMGFEGRYELAAAAILLAAGLDAVDGRVARLINGTSRFGAELDSLADAISFGVAPAMVLYFSTLHTLGISGWLVALVFAAAIALRLARFNVSIDTQAARDWRGNFFRGMPAPAAAAVVLLPLYLSFGGSTVPAGISALFVTAVALLAISTVPFYSGKKSRLAASPRGRLMLAAAVILAAAALIMHLWAAASVLAALYLAAIPWGVLHYARCAAHAAALLGDNNIAGAARR